MAATGSRRFFAMALAVCFLISCRPAPRVVVVTKGGGEIGIGVEVADSPSKRTLGLQYRTDLKEDQGVLFLFPAASVQTFWMKNTPLSLDLLFIGSDRTIVGIIHEAVPFSTATLSVSAPSQFVLEVRGGMSRRWGVEVGDRVRFVNIPLDEVRE